MTPQTNFASALLEGRATSSPYELLELIQCTLGPGDRWVDQSFPPKQESIFGAAPNVLNQERDGWENISWKSWPNENTHNTGCDYPSLFPTDGAKPGSVRQGRIGDCYFLSAVSAVAEMQKGAIESLITSTPQAFSAGISICRFYVDCRWIDVPVDHYLPHFRESGRLAFSFSDPGTLWVSILEKAWAKIHGSYLAIEGGTTHTVFRAFSGAPCLHYDLSEVRCPSAQQIAKGVLDAFNCCIGGCVSSDQSTKSTETVWNALKEANVKKYPVCADVDSVIINGSKGGLLVDHSYTVLDVWDGGVWGNRAVKLRNPWGYSRHRCSGIFGNRDTTSILKEAFNIKARPSGASWYDLQGQHDSDEDGIFWMSFEKFVEKFESIDICKLRRGYTICSADLSTPEVVEPNLPFFFLGFALELQTILEDVVEMAFSFLFLDDDGRPAQTAGIYLEVLEYSAEGVVLVGSSTKTVKTEVSVEALIRPDCSYWMLVQGCEKKCDPAVVLRSCRTSIYGPSGARFRFYEEDLSELRRIAYVAASSSPDAEVMLNENGAKFGMWCDLQPQTHIFFADAVDSRHNLYVVLNLTVKNALMQLDFPAPAADEDKVAALSGTEYARTLFFDVPPGQRQFVVISMVDASKPISISTTWEGSASPCIQCGVPAGVAVPGRFCGAYHTVISDVPGRTGNRIHSECCADFAIERAERCMHCGKEVIVVLGVFSGSLFRYAENDAGLHAEGVVHEECDADWRRKLALESRAVLESVKVAGNTHRG